MSFHPGQSVTLECAWTNDQVSHCDVLPSYNSNTHSPVIYIGSKIVYQNLAKHKTGDVIKFRFESQRKKLVIDLVRILYSTVHEIVHC